MFKRDATQPQTATNPFRNNADFSGNESVGKREHQEDYSLFRLNNASTEILAVLSDGMGGHACGEVASKKAVEAFDASFNDSSAASIPARLGAAMQQANTEISDSIRDIPALAGMGCTLVGLHISQEEAQWISVGDSPLFLYRGAELQRLNADHSMTPVIEDALRNGKISKEEAATHPNRHALRSAITGESLSLIDAPKPIQLYNGDILVLASDGILTLMPNEISAQLSSHASAESMAKKLIAAVESKKHPRQDNTTVQIIKISNARNAKNTASRTISKWLIPIGGLLLSIGVVIGGYFLVKNYLSPKSTAPENSEPNAIRPTPAPHESPEEQKEARTETSSTVSPSDKTKQKETISSPKTDKESKKENTLQDKPAINAPGQNPLTPTPSAVPSNTSTPTMPPAESAPKSKPNQKEQHKKTPTTDTHKTSATTTQKPK
jgi:PPM family protein phosphatase